MKKTLLILAIFSFPALVFADAFDDANDMYAQGDYESAATAYEQIIAGGSESSELYYNLGNAYYRMDDMASAILNYERALKLDPYDPDIIHNLDFVRARTVDKINPAGEMLVSKWWKDLRNIASSDVWAYTAVSLFLFMLAALATYIFAAPVWLRKTGFALSVVSLAFCILSIVFSAQQKDFQEGGNEAIIFAPTVTVKSSPDNSGTDLFILHTGTKVKVGDNVGSWVEITMQDGNSGWMPSDALRVI